MEHRRFSRSTLGPGSPEPAHDRLLREQLEEIPTYAEDPISFGVEWALDRPMSDPDRDTIASSAMAQAWRNAASDLGITFESPFMVHHPVGALWCAGWLPSFGSVAGTIIAGRDCDGRILDIADEMGFFAPGLSPAHYERYARDVFIEALNDWGWFSAPADAPRWFAGAFGRHGG